jgi:hypothetical protein
MPLAFALAWTVFTLALIASLLLPMWASRRSTVDWDRFMSDLEFWSATRSAREGEYK